MRRVEWSSEEKPWAQALHNAPAMKPTLLLLATMSLLSCDPPCAPFDNGIPQRVCHRADAGPVVANQAFELTAEMYTSSVSCAVVVDAGSLTLQLSGTACSGGGSTNPVVFATRANCLVPALPAGQYTLNDSARTTLTVGGADAGMEPCAF